MQRLPGERRAEVLEEEGHAAEGAVGKLARGQSTGLLEELVDDGVELRVERLVRAIAASTSSSGEASPDRTSSACALASMLVAIAADTLERSPRARP